MKDHFERFFQPASNPNVETDSSRNAELDSLTLQIKAHKRYDKKESCFSKGLGYVFGLNKAAEQSLRDLETLSEPGQKQLLAKDRESAAKSKEDIAKLVAIDSANLVWKDEINRYVGGFLKSTALFTGGTTGLLSTIGLYGLNEARAGDPLKNNLFDGTVGALKGLGMKVLFKATESVNLSAAAKGSLLSLGNTVLDAGLSRNALVHKSSGKFDLNNFLGQTVGKIDLKAAAIDGVVFGTAHHLSRALNAFSGGAIEKSKLLNNMATGATFGCTTGAQNEFVRQVQNGEFRPIKLVERSLLQGCVDAMAGGFGHVLTDSTASGQTHEAARQASVKSKAADNQPVSPGTIKALSGEPYSVQSEIRSGLPGETGVGRGLAARQQPSSTLEPPIQQIDLTASTSDLVPGEMARSSKRSHSTADLPVRPSQLNEVTERHLEEFQQIITAPLKAGSLSIEEQCKVWNDSRRQADAYLHSHRSVLLEDAIKDWARTQPDQSIRDFVDWAYEPERSAAIRLGYLADLVVAEARAANLDYVQLSNLLHAQGTFAERADSRGLTAQQHRDSLDTILRLLEDGHDPRLTTPELRSASFLFRKAALQMLLQCAEPTRIVQSNHPTCALAALEVDMYTRHPDIVTRAVAAVLTTGRFTTVDRTIISLDPASLCAEFGSKQYVHEQYRSYASQVFQTLASNVHWQRQTIAPDGRPVPAGSLRYVLRQQPGGETVGYVIDSSGKRPRRFKSGGYYSDELEETARQIGGDQSVPQCMPYNAFATPADLANWLTQRRDSSNYPMIVLIDARHITGRFHEPDFAGHFITVLGSFNLVGSRTKPVDAVALHNTWVGDSLPQFLSTQELWELTQDASYLPTQISLR